MKKNSISRYIRLLLLLLVAAISIFGCLKIFQGNGADYILGIFKSKTPREAWLQKAKKNKIYSAETLTVWDSVFQVAKSDSLNINLPHRENLMFDTVLENSAQAWRFILEGGRRLLIEIEEEQKNVFFGELYRLKDVDLKGDPQKEPIAVWDTLNKQMIYENDFAEKDALLLIVQTIPDTTTQLELKIITEPVLHFPVAGKNSKDIMSFWGASRDGGRRKHEGNDILAPRLTPLLAVVDGRVSSVREGGLGGKTVWLRDGEGRGLTYYYAHLDQQLVTAGQRVVRGDTVGLVGNTGNAKNTVSHLHFGIYKYGAIDPLPFIKNKDAIPKKSPLKINDYGEKLAIPKKNKGFLTTTPDKNAQKIRALVDNELVTLLGTSSQFYRIVTATGEKGYVRLK